MRQVLDCRVVYDHCSFVFCFLLVALSTGVPSGDRFLAVPFTTGVLGLSTFSFTGALAGTLDFLGVSSGSFVVASKEVNQHQYSNIPSSSCFAFL
jgi:hypothetical protein